MKKYIIGTIFGFILATAVGANAQGVTTVIGEVIDGAFSVKVNGVELSDQAIVVQGTSYLPVRAFGDATGYDIKFNPELGIELTKKNDISTTPIETPATPQTDPTPVKTKEQIKIETDAAIETLNMRIKMVKISISSVEGDIKESPERKDEFQKKIDELNKLITDYEAQIAALQAQK